MAKTIKEFAVKITSDAKQLETSLDKVIRRVKELSKSLSTVFTGFSRDAKKAAQQIDATINKALQNVATETKKNLDTIFHNSDCRNSILVMVQGADWFCVN